MRRTPVPSCYLPRLLGLALREQTHRAEQAELAVRMHQIRVAQAEATATAAVSGEAVARESHRQARDLRIQEWTRSGMPVPAIR